MSPAEAQRSFGEILKEILDDSNISREEFEDMMAVQLQQNPEEAVNAGIVPTVNMVTIMVGILKPNKKKERELFRSLAPLLASDESKKFSELARACRYAVGMELRHVGEKLNKVVNNDKYDPAIRIALYEIGAMYPTAEEGEALAQIYAIPENEYSIFTSKVAKTLQGNLKVVDANFVAKSRPNEDDIKAAEELVEKEDKEHEEFIVNAAAEILSRAKDKQGEEE